MKAVLAALMAALIAGTAGCGLGRPPPVSAALSDYEAAAEPHTAPASQEEGSLNSALEQGATLVDAEPAVGAEPLLRGPLRLPATEEGGRTAKAPELTVAGSADNAPPMRDTTPSAGELPVSLALVLPPVENNGGEVLRRRLVAAARLGAARILLPPPVRLTSEGVFVLNDIPSGFGPGDIAAPVLLWTDVAEPERSRFGVLAEGQGGSVVFLTGSAAAPAQAEPALSQLKRFLRSQAGRDTSCTLLLEQALWTVDPALWREVAAALRQVGSAAVIAFGDRPELLWQQHGGIDCLAVPRRMLRDEPGVLWLALGRQGPKVSLLHSASVSDIRRFDRQVQEEHDRLVKSLTTTPVSGLRPETSVRFKNTMDRVLDLRANWRFSDDNAVAVQPQILGFQLDPGEEFQQDFRFQLDAGRVLKFQRPRFRLFTEVPDGRGGQVPLVIQAVPWCCMRGEVQRVDTELSIDGDPSEWAGRGYALNHESQVLEGLDAWQGPADLSANLFVSRTSEALLVGAQLYDDRHGDAELESRLSFHLAVELGAAGTAVPSRLDLRFDPQLGLTTTAGLDDIRSAWASTGEAMLVEAAIPLSLFAGDDPPELVRLDASLAEPVGENGRVSLVFSGRDPALGDPSLFGTFRMVRNGGEGE